MSEFVVYEARSHLYDSHSPLHVLKRQPQSMVASSSRRVLVDVCQNDVLQNLSFAASSLSREKLSESNHRRGKSYPRLQCQCAWLHHAELQALALHSIQEKQALGKQDDSLPPSVDMELLLRWRRSNKNAVDISRMLRHAKEHGTVFFVTSDSSD